MVSYKQIGGRPCLDFVNTVSAWAPDAAAGRFTPVEDRLSLYYPRLDPRAARRARSLRVALYQTFRAAIEGRRPDAADLEVVNGELRRARAGERLIAGRHGFELATGGGVDPLAAIVLSAAELLTAPELSRVRYCPGEHCGWLFVDTSKSGRRRWCDMSDCGNADKVRRFRERHRAERRSQRSPRTS
jgi:predicted RNA-binding Zn ribbon-like protein